ncbi:MAG: response regulator [Desulfobacula sp.]|jgi:CheY-like chemotaxis protein
MNEHPSEKSEQQDILVVDNTLANLQLLTDILREQGYRVRPASSGSLALRSVASELPDLILLDVKMPGMNGYEVCRHLKADEYSCKIPVIFISALTETAQKIEGFKAGGVDFISKPFEPEEVLARVRTHLQLYELTEHLEKKVAERTRNLSVVNKQLKESEQRLTSIIDLLPDALFGINLKGEVILWNKAIEEMTGISEENIIGKGNYEHALSFFGKRRPILADLVLRPDPEYENQYETIQRQGNILTGDTYNHHIRGNPRFLTGKAAPLYDAEGKAIGALEIIHDITHLKRIEEEVKKHRAFLEERVKERTAELVIAKEQAESATKAKSMFLANMSHEIRTPMNAIFGYTALALRTSLTMEQADYINRIKKSSTILLEIINDILDFSKIEAGKLEIEKKNFHPQDILEDLADIFARQADDKGIELIIGADHKVPELLMGDYARIRQILINLTSNAIKFTSAGEVFIHVILLKEDKNLSTLCFHVKDTGIGISRENLNIVFSAFSQVDGNMTRKYGGTGLGLAICKNLADAMGGEIQVKSEPGKGSTFSLIVTFEKPKASPGFPYLLDTDFKGKRVLVADDNTNCRKVLTKTMVSLGFQVTEADSGREALRLFQEKAGTDNPFELLVIDWKMPPPDGLNVSQAIRKDSRFASIPIILISGFVSGLDVSRVVDIGINTFLVKPVKLSVLFDALMQVFGKKPMDEKFGLKGVMKSTQRYPFNLKGTNILLAEDNEINQEVVLKLLTEEGITADVAISGKDALEAVKNTSYDAILMDIQMPEMDGYETTRRIREYESGLKAQFTDTKEIHSASLLIPRVPIIAMTAHALRGDREKCLAAGMDDYISKPVEPDLLFIILEKWIDRSQKADDREPMVRKIPSPLLRSDATDSLPSLAGVDISEALHRLRGDMPLFKKILKQFGKKWTGLPKELNETLSAGDLPRLRHLAHTLKGTAGNISAKRLQAAAGQLEKAILNPNDPKEGMIWSEINIKIKQVEETLAQVLESVACLETSEKNLQRTEDDSGKPQRRSLSEIKPILVEFSQHLADYDPEVEDFLESIVKHLIPWDVEEECHTIQSQINEFDFKGALNTLKRITDRIGIQI